MPGVAGRGRGRRTISEINMVPFIDVMLVLLIIFMVTAPLITPSMIDLPSVGKANKQPDQIIQVIVGKSDTLELKVKGQTSSITLKALPSAVKQAQGAFAAAGAGGGGGTGGSNGANSAVIISADRTVQYESVVKVMDALQRAGIQRVGLSVQLAP